jgi:hypothetical protein
VKCHREWKRKLDSFGKKKRGLSCYFCSRFLCSLRPFFQNRPLLGRASTTTTRSESMPYPTHPIGRALINRRHAATTLVLHRISARSEQKWPAPTPHFRLAPDPASRIRKTNKKPKASRPPCPGTLKAARRPPVGAERTLPDAAAHRPRPAGDSELLGVPTYRRSARAPQPQAGRPWVAYVPVRRCFARSGEAAR